MRCSPAALALVFVAVGLAACGGAGGDQPSSAPTAGASIPVTAPDTTSAAVTTPSTATTTPVSLSSSATPTDTTGDLPGTGRPTVLLGDMNTPEQFIIGDLYADALAAQGYAVDVDRNIGPTAVSEAAMSEGSLDLFPEYLDVYDTQVAGDSARFASLQDAFQAGQSYANANGQTLLAPTPFSDTAGVVVLTSFARAHHLHTIGDLRRVQDQLTFGSPLEFSAEPGGLAALEQAYDFAPGLTTVVTIGTQYRALVDGEVDAAYDQTTDWQLTEPIYTDLLDSEHVLGYGNVVPVVSSDVLTAEGPAFAETIDRVDALLTTRAIRGLTSEMQDATQPAVAAAEVAKEFLQGYGILPPPAWSTTTSPTTTTPTSTTRTSTTPTSTTPTSTTPTSTRITKPPRPRHAKAGRTL